MSKTFMTKHKAMTGLIAVSLALIIMLGGTFAWQSINQTALNEVSSTVNPGGRLHDDYIDITYGADGIADYSTMTFNKDVYVENFTSLASNGVQVYARIRLDEYMEIGKNAGQENSEAISVVSTATLADKSSWTTHIMNNDNDPFHDYWTWDLDGQTTYMPTFNKDKNSLDADINGVFPDFENTYTDYAGVTDKFDDVTVLEGEAIYERNADGTTKKSVKETHEVKPTLTSTVISMAAYQEILNDGNPDNDTGDYWVWDTDGWAYWANPILPDTATGLLLDEIKRTDAIIDEDWYYAINVVAQFITKDDIGYKDGDGFYDDKDGSLPPTADALLLLDEIGVDVTYEADDAEELEKALAHGGNIVLTDDITISKPLTVSANTTLDLGGHTINNTEIIYDETAKVWSLISVKGADTTLTINGGNFTAKADDCFAVDVRDGASVVINDGTFVGNISAVYVYEGTALINGGNFSIQQLADGAADKYNQMINAYNANLEAGKATITICGGKFEGFNPEAADDGNLVAANYEVVKSDDGNVYTVSKVAASTGEVTE